MAGAMLVYALKVGPHACDEPEDGPCMASSDALVHKDSSWAAKSCTQTKNLVHHKAVRKAYHTLSASSVLHSCHCYECRMLTCMRANFA